MLSAFEDMVEPLVDHPVKQGLLAAFFTLLFEDPTVVSCGLLVADDRMHFWAAYIGLAGGIMLGDLFLYTVGRYFGPVILRRRWVSRQRFQQARLMIQDNLLLAIFMSRFLPGTRIPTYMGTGIVRISFPRFLVIAIGASMAWTLFLLTISIRIGEAVLPLLGNLKWYIVLAVLIVVLTVSISRRMRASRMAKAEMVTPEPVTSFFQFWHPVLFYLPVALYYLALAVRYRSLSLPSVANPSIYTGGICGESKSAILDLVPEKHRHLVARYAVVRRGAEDPVAVMERSGLTFPIVAKPDIGQRGDGVCVVHDAADLARYLARHTSDVPVILQELINHPHEAGVFCYRYPGDRRGRVLSLAFKEFPLVTGDGRRTLRELILADPRASLITPLLFDRHLSRLDTVLPEGEVYPLVFAGNHSQGAFFRNGGHLITREFERMIDDIVRDIPGFYYGRLDIRIPDPESLLAGRDLRIVEINGAGSEVSHIWDPNTKLSEAYRALFRQLRILFRLADRNRLLGHRPTRPSVILREFRRYLRLTRGYAKGG